MNRRRPFRLGLVLLLTLAAAPPPAITVSQGAVLPPTVGPGALFLALGDSIAAGVGASRPGQRGYPALLADDLDRLGDRPVERHNLAVPGETSATLLAGGQLDEALAILAQARRNGVRVSPVTLTIGANDLTRAAPARRAPALTSLSTNLRIILRRLRLATTDEAGQPTADLIVTGYYDATGGTTTGGEAAAWWVDQLNATIAREARGAGARWVDVAPRFRGRTAEFTWSPSDVHPTNAGYRAIAEAIWQTLGYDTTPPTVRIERPEAGPLARSRPTVVVVADDAVGVAVVEVVVGGVALGEARYRPELGDYALVWDTIGLAPGQHEVAATARDRAGNAATARVIVEVVAPAAAA